MFGEKSSFEGDTGLVSDQGETRPGFADFYDLIHDLLDSGVVLTGQAANERCWGNSEIFQCWESLNPLPVTDKSRTKRQQPHQREPLHQGWVDLRIDM
jgi:hypothetical protein